MTEKASASETIEALEFIEDVLTRDIEMKRSIKETYEKLSKMSPEERRELLRKEGIDSDVLENALKVVKERSQSQI